MNQIVVLNAGGQYCHLIARRIRELGVHAVVADVSKPAAELSGARGIIISGGPASVTEATSPSVDRAIYDLGVPVLGICYGHQLLARDLARGQALVSAGTTKEYGKATLEAGDCELFQKISPAPGSSSRVFTVWMSHGDTVVDVPPGFKAVGETEDCKIAAMEDRGRKFYGLQFHPEVVHTEHGTEIYRTFVFDVCGCRQDWDPRARVEQVIADIKRTAGDRKKVFFLISGGVDSTVAFSLCAKALGRDRVLGLYVDTGFMREGDAEAMQYLKTAVGEHAVKLADRSADFFGRLRGVTHPEDKRAVIGETFIAVQEDEFAKLGLREDEWLLGQGTIYPDTIESGGARHAAKIKTHHNRVAKIQALIDAGRVIEPLVDFYKDEVRVLGEELGLPHDVVWRHPFPGPGLAVRCLAAETRAAVEPAAIALPPGVEGWNVPVRTVGVQGDERSYSQLLAVSGVGDAEAAGAFARRVTNEHRAINRVAVVVFQRAGAPFGRLAIHPAMLTPERIALLRAADALVTRIVRARGLYDAIWQMPVAMLPLGSGPGRETIVLRPVNSRDGMTADFARLPAPVVTELATALGALDGVDAVLYDVTNKPPATIELE
ncbi:MAG TPA: glutamine-hydrolyzing GMP synthase [Methylomirabilota bacterium]|nr:glutamine-hydrolyzing GMP synthase [Methylomirabilota bacterium]